MLNQQSCGEQQQAYQSNDAWLSGPPQTAKGTVNDMLCLQAATASAVIVFETAYYSL